MRISIEHAPIDPARWEWFNAQLIDEEKPDGYKLRASAGGDFGFISRVVLDWLREYHPS